MDANQLNHIMNQLPKIVNDSGWRGTEFARYRGIWDYVRTIEFAEAPSGEQLMKAKLWLASDRCPGYTGVTSSPVVGRPNVFKFETTMDSSD